MSQQWELPMDGNSHETKLYLGEALFYGGFHHLNFFDILWA